MLINALNNFNSEALLAEISKYCSTFTIGTSLTNGEGNLVFNYPYYTTEFDSRKFPQLKNNDRYLFINCPRNSEIFLDFAKIADIILNVSTVEHVDLLNINVKPSDAVNAIDDIGENIINIMRAQGCLKAINVIVGWDKLQQSKHKDVKFYFKRLFDEDFPESKTHFLQQSSDLLKMLTDLQNIDTSQIEWRKERGYFLVDKVEFSNIAGQAKKIYLSGHLKNNITTEELVHITGIGDFKIEAISGTLSNKHDSITIMKPVYSHHPFDLFGDDISNVIKETKGMFKRK